MKTINFTIIQWGFFFLTLFMVALILAGIKILMKRNSTIHSATTYQSLFVGTMVWLFIIIFLSLTGVTSDFSIFPPRLLLVIVPPFLFSLYITLTGKADFLLKVTPPYWLVVIQSFRIFVEIFLYLLYEENQVPIQMTFEGRNWDILAGVSGLVIGLFWWRKKKYSLISLVVFNVVGLVLLFNIVIIAMLSAPSPYRIFLEEPANTIVGYFPFVFLPSVLVPIAYLMHFLSLRQGFLLSRNK